MENTRRGGGVQGALEPLASEREIVFDENVLCAIAHRRPPTIDEMSRILGLGLVRESRHVEEIWSARNRGCPKHSLCARCEPSGRISDARVRSTRRRLASASLRCSPACPARVRAALARRAVSASRRSASRRAPRPRRPRTRVSGRPRPPWGRKTPSSRVPRGGVGRPPTPQPRKRRRRTRAPWRRACHPPAPPRTRRTASSTPPLRERPVRAAGAIPEQRRPVHRRVQVPPPGRPEKHRLHLHPKLSPRVRRPPRGAPRRRLRPRQRRREDPRRPGRRAHGRRGRTHVRTPRHARPTQPVQRRNMGTRARPTGSSRTVDHQGALLRAVLLPRPRLPENAPAAILSPRVGGADALLQLQHDADGVRAPRVVAA